MTTMQPYPPGTKWTWAGRQYRTATFTEELVLLWEPNGSSISDEHLPEEVSAGDLWRRWVDEYADRAHRQDPGLYLPGEVPILWTVTTPRGMGVFEFAPHSADRRGASHALRENFLTHYTDPVHAETGDPLNWARLPVVDRGWSAERVEKGGFVQEASGWKPSPLQETVNVRQLGAAAGVYVPDLVVG
ncbi:hypothetical protein ACWEWX_39910 [Streptomyces asiaticus]